MYVYTYDIQHADSKTITVYNTSTYAPDENIYFVLNGTLSKEHNSKNLTKA